MSDELPHKPWCRYCGMNLTLTTRTMVCHICLGLEFREKMDHDFFLPALVVPQMPLVMVTTT
jgi:hypothetical protein